MPAHFNVNRHAVAPLGAVVWSDTHVFLLNLGSKANPCLGAIAQPTRSIG